MKRERRSGPRSEQCVAIVGAGFSGACLAIRLLERGGLAEVVLIDRSGVFGPGLAYSTTCDAHLLNVRAVRMSLRADDPDDFVRWLAARDLGPRERGVGRDGFARRADYGAYVRERLAEAGRRRRATLVTLAAEVVGLTRDDAGWRLTLGDGRAVRADAVVLATGNAPPGRLRTPGLEGVGAAYVADPWAAGALDGVGPGDDLFLVGAGLTAVDVLLALETRGWRGRAHAASRHGLSPRPHALRPSRELGREAPRGGRLSEQLRRLRREAAATSWTRAMDGVRPHGQALWRAASTAERARFLRHARPWWDAHRHRMAPEVAAEVERLRAEGRLSVRAGRLLRVEREEGRLTVVYAPRGGGKDGAAARAPVDRIVNCTGPQSDPARGEDALLRGLAADGTVRADAFGLGLATDGRGRVLDGEGRARPGLYAMGPLTRGALWEIVAVPEIREQAARLAAELAQPGVRRPPARRRVGPATAHLDEVGESYVEHMGVAFGVGGRMLAAGAACLIHGVAPFLFQKTGSRAIDALHRDLSRRRRVGGP